MVVVAWRIIAMLVFCLPIIVFEAMFDAREVERGRGQSDQDEEHASVLEIPRRNAQHRVGRGPLRGGRRYPRDLNIF
jgi:hypothetical protein